MNTAVKIPFAFKKSLIPEDVQEVQEPAERLDISLVDAFVRHMKENPDMAISDISTDKITLGSWRNRQEYKCTTLKITIKEPV